MRILWLKTELLHPVDKGGRIRTYNMLRELKQEHEVIYLTLDEEPGDREALERSSEYADELIRVPHHVAPRHSVRFYTELVSNLVSPLPYFIERYRSDRMRRAVTKTLENCDLDVLVCDFLTPAVNLPDALPLPSVLFQHNVEAEIWRRHHEVADNPLKRLYFYHQWKKTRDFEARACRRFDRVVAVSEEDRKTLEDEYELDDVASVETGVDTDYFRPRDGHPVRTNHIVFTGSMDWLPNEDAMAWFVREILPRIREEVPDATLSVVGRRPSQAVLNLEDEAPGVTVTGGVPDVRPYLEEAAVFVVPLRIGGGTRLKIYEAMAMERPVVSTRVGKEGLPVSHGEELRVADEPDDFAAEVSRLLADRQEARRLGQRGAERVRQDFGWDRVAASFARICKDATRVDPAGKPGRERSGPDGQEDSDGDPATANIATTAERRTGR